MSVDDGAFSFQTGPGRIVLGAFASADGAGVSADRVSAEENAAEAPVPFRLLPTDDQHRQVARLVLDYVELSKKPDLDDANPKGPVPIRVLRPNWRRRTDYGNDAA